MKKYQYLLWICLCGILALPSCKEDPVDEPDFTTYEFDAATATQASVQEAMINMQDGDVIKFGAGTFTFTSTLSVQDKNNIRIEGAGRDQTILDFTGQISGAEGVKVTNCDMILFYNLTVQNTAGDGIKATDCNGITFHGVGAVWTGTPSEENGAYGIYPVLCENVLIDDCYTRGASDAGIYVGQSQTIIARNSTVEENVAGLEIENCIAADVYNITARNNTGGILVFDLPGLNITNGTQCRVYNNTVIDNSHRNFAPAGNIVGQVPPGTGIMILAGNQVEVFNNTITNNNVMGLGLVSYSTLEALTGSSSNDPDFNKYITEIYIKDNTFSRTTDYPADLNDMGNFLVGMFPDGDIRDIVYDGTSDPINNDTPLCLDNPGGSFVKLDLIFNNHSFDPMPYECTLNRLPEVSVIAPTP